MPTESSAFATWRSARAELVAPPLHTAILVAWITLVNVVGLLMSRGHAAPALASSQGSKIVDVYLPAAAAEWLVAAYVVFLPRRRDVLTNLMGREWNARWRWPVDLGCALALIAVIVGFELILARFLGVQQNPAIVALLPRTVGQRCAWALLAASAGFCEELVYRGYLRTQLTALVRSAPIANVLQALLFGFAHAEQGSSAMIRFAFYGVAFGIVAARRASLLPCIAAHVSIDLAAGLLAH